MRDDIRTEVLDNIKRDYKFDVANGDWLQKGKCPQCQKRELYTSASKPWVMRCGRQNRCGWEGEVRDLYPEIFDNWSNRHQQSETNPHAAADAYLRHARGLDLRLLASCYTQETFTDRSRGLSSATVRFPLPGGSHWERLIDQPGRFEKKAHFAYGKTYKGQWWQHPAHTIEDLAAAKEIWIAEGIFDCAALVQAFGHAELKDSGLTAVSAMSVNNYPEHALDALRKAIASGLTPTHQPRLVFAFDIGKAGADYTRKYVKRARDENWEATAAQPRPEGEDDKLDWNNLLVRERLTAKHLGDYRANGAVLIAADAFEKAYMMWQRRESSSFPLTFNNEIYWAEFSPKKIADTVKELTENNPGRDPKEVRQEAAEQAGLVTRICNASFRTLYFQRNPATEESLYYLRIDFPVDKPVVKAGFSGGAMSASAEFKKRMLSCASGALWRGTGEQLDRLLEAQTRRLKTVETLDATGYDPKRQVYVLGDIAVRKGRVFDLNDEDFFEFGDCSLKLATNERMLRINYDSQKVPTEWFPVVVDAFGENGLITVAYFLLSLFAVQVRLETKSLGFLEMSGLPGTGKSTLIMFLWKILGHGHDDYEGFDPNKSTSAGMARTLGKVSNLPVVFLEGDSRDDATHGKKFEWEELKSLYNGGATRTRGVKTGGMETFEPQFRGSIVIAQNNTVNATPAVMERIMGLHFDKSRFSPATQLAAEKLEQLHEEDLSGFIIHMLRREDEFLKIWRDCYPRYRDELQSITGVKNVRLLRNHAQLAAALTAMRCILPVSDGLHRAGLEFIADMTRQRQLVTSSEHPVVEKFWHIFDYLIEIEPDNIERSLNNSRKADAEIAVNLPQFFERCRSHGQNPPSEDDLRRQLKASKARKFIGQKSVNSPSGKFFHCWVFQRPLSENPVI